MKTLPSNRLDPLRATLLPSRHQMRLSAAAETYLAIPDDDLLHGFRRKAGQPAPGNGMSGWCADTFIY